MVYQIIHNHANAQCSHSQHPWNYTEIALQSLGSKRSKTVTTEDHHSHNLRGLVQSQFQLQCTTYCFHAKCVVTVHPRTASVSIQVLLAVAQVEFRSHTRCLSFHQLLEWWWFTASQCWSYFPGVTVTHLCDMRHWASCSQSLQQNSVLQSGDIAVLLGHLHSFQSFYCTYGGSCHAKKKKTASERTEFRIKDE